MEKRTGRGLEKRKKGKKKESTEQFNELTPAEHERLSILFGECSEVIKVVSKIMRHGYENRGKDGGKTNRELLQIELGDVKFAAQFMCDSGDLSEIKIEDESRLKNLTIGAWLHHQDTQ